jgi:queuine tRNA-ribosyltransferase
MLVHPGADTVAQAGGLHSFINRPYPIITDSGGFQVFSLAYGTVKDELKSKKIAKGSEGVIKISEEGVLFRSYKDGSPIMLTPETSIQAQKKLGADIIIPFDELPAYSVDRKKLIKSLDRTHRWQVRSLQEHTKNIQDQAMYAVIHGGVDIELRKKSCQFLSDKGFDGYAIGGSLGKNTAEMVDMLTHIMPYIPDDKPNHLLGIGDLPSIDACISLGIDTFDSSHPTRCARHGLLFTARGYVKIKQTYYKNKFEPIDPKCSCLTCTQYSSAYIHHLFKAKEITAYTLSTIHNLHYMIQLMKQYRERILNDQI